MAAKLYRLGLIDRSESGAEKQAKASWLASKVVERRVYRLDELRTEEVTDFLQWLSVQKRSE